MISLSPFIIFQRSSSCGWPVAFHRRQGLDGRAYRMEFVVQMLCGYRLTSASPVSYHSTNGPCSFTHYPRNGKCAHYRPQLHGDKILQHRDTMHNMAAIQLHLLTVTIFSTMRLNYSLNITQLLPSSNASKLYHCLKMCNVEIYSYTFISTKKVRYVIFSWACFCPARAAQGNENEIK